MKATAIIDGQPLEIELRTSSDWEQLPGSPQVKRWGRISALIGAFLFVQGMIVGGVAVYFFTHVFK